MGHPKGVLIRPLQLCGGAVTEPESVHSGARQSRFEFQLSYILRVRLCPSHLICKMDLIIALRICVRMK